MDDRIRERRKDFKQAFDDPLARRENELVQIRKLQRDEFLARKRQELFHPGGGSSSGALTEASLEGTGGTGTGGGTEASGAACMNTIHGSNDYLEDVRSLPNFVADCMSSDLKRQLDGAQSIRRLLSVETSPPIENVVASGIIPRLVDFLRSDNEDLQFEAAWAVTNVASGETEPTRAVVEAGALVEFVKLLRSENIQVREQATWGLGNIAGDCPEFRDELLRQGVLDLLINELNNRGKTGLQQQLLSLARYGTWALSNLCRGQPLPSPDIMLKALPTLRSLLDDHDVEILTDAIWACALISDYAHDPDQGIASRSIDALMDSAIARKIVKLSGQPNISIQIQTAALKFIGNILTGESGPTQQMINCDCLKVLKDLLRSPRRRLRQEAAWAISNVTAGTTQQIQNVIDEGIIPELVRLLMSDEFNVKREVAWAITNAAYGGTPSQVERLVEAQCFQPLVALLNVKDMKLVKLALDGLDNMLAAGERQKVDKNLPENPYLALLDDSEGFDKIERLCGGDMKNREILQAALKIVQTYFESYLEDQQTFSHDGGPPPPAAVHHPPQPLFGGMV